MVALEMLRASRTSFEGNQAVPSISITRLSAPLRSGGHPLGMAWGEPSRSASCEGRLGMCPQISPGLASKQRARHPPGTSLLERDPSLSSGL